MPSRNDTPEPAPRAASFNDDFSFGPAPTPASANAADPVARVERPAEKPQAARPWEIPAQAAPAPSRPVPVPKPSRQPQPAPSDMALRAAFLRGMGVEEADFPGRDAIVEMEKFGREYRLMLDG
ncbi:type VI secretion system-associated FHA domain protein TagH, partial [Mesorhizobium sp. M1C.F.Ca.ET.204.01.1.1]